MSICTVHLLLLQDGNGPDPQWGFHLLGDEDGVILLPNGAFNGAFVSSGARNGPCLPVPITYCGPDSA
jgi:hypothetical protein